MRAILQTPHERVHLERVHLALVIALLAACAANVALVWSWL
jgi:hypothetical protein